MIRLTAFVIIGACLFSCSSPTEDDQAVTSVRVKNLTGFNLSDIEADFYFGAETAELPFGKLADGAASGYQEIPFLKISDDGSYCSIVNAFIEEWGFRNSLGVLCTGLNSNRSVRLQGGNYTYILEYMPADYLGLVLEIDEQSPDDSEVLIRVLNLSDRYMKEVIGLFPGDDTPREVHFGSIESGSLSGYKQIGAAYRYAHIKAVFNRNIAIKDTLELQPIDYVGESLLPPGKYTYQLDVGVGRKDVSRIVKD